MGAAPHSAIPFLIAASHPVGLTRSPVGISLPRSSLLLLTISPCHVEPFSAETQNCCCVNGQTDRLGYHQPVHEMVSMGSNSIDTFPSQYDVKLGGDGFGSVSYIFFLSFFLF